MSDAYIQIVDDLAAEHASFAEMLGDLGGADFERPTHAPGWAVRDQIAHLAHIDEAATLAMVDEAAFLAEARAGGSVPVTDGQFPYIIKARELSHADLVAWWRHASSALVEAARALDPSRRMPWYGPPMSATSFVTARLMECWSHGLDVEDVIAFKRQPSDRLRHIVFLGVRTRNY
ncbi:MAG: maleylpyruvate isomerase N-terminal domain-containing protein, partial [Dehalococcoidia bacterium]|nr:maleylpyruvate isomerase N-terminal domain-containing protein [Dehalococcoidia bacterium]